MTSTFNTSLRYFTTAIKCSSEAKKSLLLLSWAFCLEGIKLQHVFYYVETGTPSPTPQNTRLILTAMFCLSPPMYISGTCSLALENPDLGTLSCACLDTAKSSSFKWGSAQEVQLSQHCANPRATCHGGSDRLTLDWLPCKAWGNLEHWWIISSGIRLGLQFVVLALQKGLAGWFWQY